MNWNDVINFASKGNQTPERRVEKSDAEWMQVLSPEVFQITRKKGTERAFTGEYCEAHDPGLYGCACCGTLLFDSRQKFESGTGWPSFNEPVNERVIKYEMDTSYGMQRVEVMCNVCDGHLGHVFPDGPKPTGLRYCINSASITLQSNQ
jgi:methionine-R-sulfoxide reductase